MFILTSLIKEGYIHGAERSLLFVYKKEVESSTNCGTYL